MSRAVLPVLIATIAATLSPADATAADSTATIRWTSRWSIGHRGAPGTAPSTPSKSYRTAILLGADYVEPDLVATRDGVLVARHENLITDTTDVPSHPEFADRRTTKVVDGHASRAGSPRTSPWPSSRRSARRSGCPPYGPRTRRTTASSRCPPSTRCSPWCSRRAAPGKIGVYPETKHPSVLPLDRAAPRAADAGRAATATGWTGAGRTVFLQSFETGNLRELNKKTQLPIIQLLDSAGAPWDLRSTGDPRTYRDLTTPTQLRQIATYADGIGPNKDLVIPRDSTARTPAHHLVRDAHRDRPGSRTFHVAPGEPVHGRRLPPRQRPRRGR